MKTLLKIQASLFGARGQSSQLADRFIDDFRNRHGSVRIITRDLAADPVPPLTLARFQALGTGADDRTVEQQTIVDDSDALVEELMAADVIVLAVPMYNLTIPAALHNYFDHITRPGLTFRYTKSGPEGLIKGKQAVVLLTRGGSYEEEHPQTTFLRKFLAFLGLQDTQFIHVDGLAISEASRENSLATATHEIAKLVPQLTAAA